MVRTKLLLIIGVTLSLTHGDTAFADDTTKIDGTVYLDAESCAKGMANRDCLLNFAINGKAAKALFDGMAAKAKKEECTGGMEKSDGNGLHCIKGSGPTDYTCDFGYHFKDHKFASSSIDC